MDKRWNDCHKKTAAECCIKIARRAEQKVLFHFDFPPSLSHERLCLSVFSRESPQCLRWRNGGETSRNIVTALAKLLKTFINQTVCCNGC